jgi:hypothetical protein
MIGWKKRLRNTSLAGGGAAGRQLDPAAALRYQ